MLALFGKLPAKRDFVARGVPGAALTVLEPFLQAAVAEGRDALGPSWTDRFLTAPIWRFWFSHEVFGAGAKGAIMPSVDQVGRYFPLAAFDLVPAGTDHPVPSAADALWFDALEDAMLSALDHDGTLDDLLGRLEALPPLRPAVAPGYSGTLWWTQSGATEGPRKSAWPSLPPFRTFGLMLAGAVDPLALPVDAYDVAGPAGASLAGSGAGVGTGAGDAAPLAAVPSEPGA